MSNFNCAYMMKCVFALIFVDPSASVLVEITAPDSPVIDQPLTLQCTVTTVMDIDSRVDIVWSTGNTQVRRVNNVAASDIITLTAYEDTFVTPPLDISDIGSVYHCKVIINSSPLTMEQDDFTIPFPGM